MSTNFHVDCAVHACTLCWRGFSLLNCLWCCVIEEQLRLSGQCESQCPGKLSGACLAKIAHIRDIEWGCAQRWRASCSLMSLLSVDGSKCFYRLLRSHVVSGKRNFSLIPALLMCVMSCNQFMTCFVLLMFKRRALTYDVFLDIQASDVCGNLEACGCSATCCLSS